MRTVLLEEMTWPEVRQALNDGYKTVLIFAAAVEQHGEHLAENTDTMLGYAEAEDLARRLGNALVAPVIRPGLSEHHMALPGSVTLRPEVFAGVVQDYIAAYVRHGFDTVILSSSHGGNFAALEKIAEEQTPLYPDVAILTGCSLQDMTVGLLMAEKQEGLAPGACGGHACDFETSVMLAVAPQYVFMDKAKAGYVGPVSEEFVQKMFQNGITGVSEIGVIGDPAGADAARGRRYFEMLQQLQVDTIRAKLAALRPVGE